MQEHPLQVICTIGYRPSFLPEEDRQAAYAVDRVATERLIQACVAAKIPGRFVLVTSLGVDPTPSTQCLRVHSKAGYSTVGCCIGDKLHANWCQIIVAPM